MKNLSYVLAILLLLQSCSVYNRPATVEAAVAADKKVQVITTTNQKYNFRRLENNNDRLIGVTKMGSTTANKLAGMTAVIEGKFIEFDISVLEIEEIKFRNETASTLLTAGMISLVIASLILMYDGLTSESAAEQFLRDLDNLKTNK